MISAEATPELWLVRHGETEWSRDHRHTSSTDIPLTEKGVEVARTLSERLTGSEFDLVLTSPRQRARRTAELAGFEGAIVDDDRVDARVARRGDRRAGHGAAGPCRAQGAREPGDPCVHTVHPGTVSRISSV